MRAMGSRHLRLWVVLAAMLSPHAEAAERYARIEPPRVDEKFTTLVVSGLESASTHLRPMAFAKIQAAVKRHRCLPGEAQLFKKQGSPSIVLLVPCKLSSNKEAAPEDLHEGYYAYLEYPLAWVVNADRVAEAELYRHGFLYNSGVVSAITDIDGNGMPEFWLTGDVCGEADDAQCDNNGLKVMEFNNGRLRNWERPGRPKRD